MKVGFIGLGHMGAGMAANLVKAGHDVTVYNRTRRKVEALVAQGAKAAPSVSDACTGDAVITMLADDDAVETIVGRNVGQVHGTRAGDSVAPVIGRRLDDAEHPRRIEGCDARRVV